MLNKTIAIAVVTHYPRWYRGELRSIKHTDKVRGDLALQFVKKAVKSGYRIVVADSCSTKTFRRELHTIENAIIINRRSQKRSVGKRQAIKKASNLSGVKIIVLSEPEKISLLQCLPKIASPLFEDKADIVIPKRDTKLFQQTYPSYMYLSEIEGNTAYNQILRKNHLLIKRNPDLDMFFGPRAFVNKPNIVSLFMKNFSLPKKNLVDEQSYSAEDYSNTLFFPIIIALKKKMKIMSVTVPFRYPKLQKDNEKKGKRDLFIEKRKNQRESLLSELSSFIKNRYR